MVSKHLRPAIARFLPLLSALCLAPWAAIPAADAPAKKPNILIILADDLGYADFPGHASRDLAVPNLDQLVRSGVSFSQGYVSAPQCSPSRAGLLTGRYQQRFGHENNGCSQAAFTAGAKTLAEHLRPAGYATAAFGKWHLGDGLPSHRPGSRGFDESFGYEEYQEACRDGSLGFPGAAASPRAFHAQVFASRAADFIQSHASRPWCIYLALHEPHVDLEPTEESANLTRASSSDPLRQSCLAVLHDLDAGVGIIMKKLRDLGLEQDTLVVFLSDNGAPTKEGVDAGADQAPGKSGKEDDKAANGSRNDPLRGRKGLLWEGGIRVPFVISWPGRIPGGRSVDEPVISLDLLPTSLAAAGVAPLEGTPLDGTNLLPFLEGQEKHLPERTLYWRYADRNLMAVRAGQWKLIQCKTPSTQLFDLTADPSETTDLSAKHPEIVAKLQAAWDRWNAEMKAPINDPKPEKPLKEKPKKDQP